MTDKPLVIVTWNDAHGDATTARSADDIQHKPMVMLTVGWLLRDDGTGVSLAAEHCTEDKTWRGITFVPRGMVISVGHIVRPRRPRKVKEQPACDTSTS
jgi:hypothetical protein